MGRPRPLPPSGIASRASRSTSASPPSSPLNAEPISALQFCCFCVWCSPIVHGRSQLDGWSASGGGALERRTPPSSSPSAEDRKQVHSPRHEVPACGRVCEPTLFLLPPHKSRRHWRVQSRRRWHRASRPSHQCRPRAIPPTSLSRPPPPLRNRSWLLLSNTLLRFSLAADPLRPRPPQERRPRKTAIVATITEAVTTTTMFARRATRKPPKNRSLERNDAPFRFRASLCRLLW